MNKMLLQEVLARRSPRCSPRLDSKKTSLNSVDTRPNLRALIDDRSRYQRSLCAHAAPARHGCCRMARQATSHIHLDNFHHDPRNSLRIAYSADWEATLGPTSGIRESPC